MAKTKLRRFQENLTFPHLFQPKVSYPPTDFELKGKWNSDYFKNKNEIVLELGCGRGEYVVNLAEKFPNKNFIGVDLKGARLWRGAKTALEKEMNNTAFLRIMIQNIPSFFAKNEIDEIWVTFPDPQPQQSRERKRLISPRFLDLYRNFLKPGGRVHLKTDSLLLYDYSVELMQTQKTKVLRSSSDLYSDFPSDEILSIKTTYEKIWLKEGAKICYLEFDYTIHL